MQCVIALWSTWCWWELKCKFLYATCSVRKKVVFGHHYLLFEVCHHLRNPWSASDPFDALIPSELPPAAPVSCFTPHFWKLPMAFSTPVLLTLWNEMWLNGSESTNFGVTMRAFDSARPRNCRTKAEFSVLYPAYRPCVSRSRWLRAPTAAAPAISFSSSPSTFSIPPVSPPIHPSIHPCMLLRWLLLPPSHLSGFHRFYTTPTATLETLLPPFQAGIFGSFAFDFLRNSFLFRFCLPVTVTQVSAKCAFLDWK